MKLFGLILKVLTGLFAIVVIAIGVILATVDPNDYKAEITQAVKESTGRDLNVGNMSLSIFPTLSVDLEQATLSNAQGFSDKPFVSVKKVQVGAAILPLLSKQLQVETLTLTNFKLNLEKNAEGITNWDDLLAEKPTTEQTQATSGTETSANPLEKLSSLNFGGLNIQNGQVSWKDQQAQQEIQLSNLNLSTSSITFGEFFNVALNAETQIKNPAINSQLDLQLTAKLEQNGNYNIKDIVVNNTTSGEGIPVKEVDTTLELASFVLEGEQLQIPEIYVNYNLIGGDEFPLETVKGKLNVNNVSGNIIQKSFSIEQVQSETELTGKTLPGGNANISLQTPVQVDLKNQTASLDKLEVNALDLQLNADIQASQIIDSPQASVNLNIPETNLKTTLDKLKIQLPEMNSATALSKLSAVLQITYKQASQSVKVKKLALNIDQSTLTGNANITNFAKPAVSYDLSLDKINLNDYLPPKTDKTATQPASDQQAETKIELPVETMRNLDIDGSLKVGQLTFDNLKPTNILVTTKAKNGNIQLSPVKADVFNTRVNAQAGVNVAGKTPKYNFKTDTKNLPIGEVMQVFTGDNTISGTGLVMADIITSGNTVSDFKNTLNGSVTAQLTDGAIKGFNLAQVIRQAKAKLSGKTDKAASTEEKTDFSELNAKATIKNGVVSTQTLSAKAPFMRVNGSGTVNLPKESLDYLVKTKIVTSDEGQGGEDLKELNGLTIPVKLKGSYLSPDISLDLESLLQQKAKAEIEKKKQEVVEDVKKKAEEKLKDLIPKGFGF